MKHPITAFLTPQQYSAFHSVAETLTMSDNEALYTAIKEWVIRETATIELAKRLHTTRKRTR